MLVMLVLLPTGTRQYITYAQLMLYSSLLPCLLRLLSQTFIKGNFIPWFFFAGVRRIARTV